MKTTWFLTLAAVAMIAGFTLSGCTLPGQSKNSPGVQMCEKTAAETGVKKDCQDEYGKMPIVEREMMDKMGKGVMADCGSKMKKEYEDCFKAAAKNGMGNKLD